jgi:hypothetical protein
LPQGPRFTNKQIEGARRRERRYQQWRRVNGSAYAYAERLALDAVEHERNVSGSWLVEQIRRKDFSDDEGNPCRINNDHAPLLVREIMECHPEVAPYVEKRTGIYDSIAV